MLPSKCPNCPATDSVTLRELSREAPAHWWARLFTGRRIRRYVTGYVKRCASCDATFIVTLDGVQALTALTPPATAEPAPDAQRPRPRRVEQPAWKEPPGL